MKNSNLYIADDTTMRHNNGNNTDMLPEKNKLSGILLKNTKLIKLALGCYQCPVSYAEVAPP